MEVNRSTDNNSVSTRTELSIVVPAYNEAGNIAKLFDELKKVLPSLGMSWEVIFSDDGSTDETWQEITKLHNGDSNVKGVRLSRNFGHQYALFAGLQHALGDAVVSMDSDLQHPPEVVPQLVDAWKKGSKIVNTVRLDPDDFTLAKRISAKLYYKLFSWLSGVKLEHGMADFRLLDRRVLNELLQFREEGLFLRGLVQWVGYPDTSVTFQCAERFSGTSKYNFRRMIRFAWQGITSFSIVPLRLGIGVGILTSLLSFAWMAEAMYAKIVLGTTVPGWASTVGILSFLFGILFIILGLLGAYIGRILVQVRGRPLYLVSDLIGIDEGVRKSNPSR